MVNYIPYVDNPRILAMRKRTGLSLLLCLCITNNTFATSHVTTTGNTTTTLTQKQWKGTSKTPNIIKFQHHNTITTSTNITTLPLTGHTKLHLPPKTYVVKVEKKTYTSKVFEEELQKHYKEGFFYYGTMFLVLLVGGLN